MLTQTKKRPSSFFTWIMGDLESSSLWRSKSHCLQLHLASSLHKFCFNAGNWNHFNMFGCIHFPYKNVVYKSCYQCWPPRFLIRNFCTDFGPCLYLTVIWVLRSRLCSEQRLEDFPLPSPAPGALSQQCTTVGPLTLAILHTVMQHHPCSTVLSRIQIWGWISFSPM